MNKAVTLIFPHQLHAAHPAIAPGREVYLIEEALFFSQYTFHKQKLILHRASMQFYQSWLEEKGHVVQYVSDEYARKLKGLGTALKTKGVTTIHCCEVYDFYLEKRLRAMASACGFEIRWYDSPNFVTPTPELVAMLSSEKSYLMGSFYIKQRKRLNLLVEGDAPVGGKWSFDAENRKKVPKGTPMPPVWEGGNNAFVEEARAYVNAKFPDAPGASEPFPYPVTFEEAAAALEHFLRHRMRLFGDYEDAILKQEHFLWHSLLTPALNTGLLSPMQVVAQTMSLHTELDFPLNSLEGFLRQIIGWREYMHGIYQLEGVRERTTNFFGFSRKMPAAFWEGNTGLPPVDDTIRKVLRTGYCHHIERLMILGNFMLLCEIDPDEVYEWFMALFIDAYDWVMVPNVYGMSQYSDGGLITTKPYVSGSNYVRKMSDYRKGDWCAIWDGLYWRFIHTHKERFRKNPRMSMMIRLSEKMEAGKLAGHLEQAEAFLARL